MKKQIVLLMSLLFTFVGINVLHAQASADEVIKMNEEMHDFGKVKQGVPAVCYFEIKNISNKPVVVENTWASCGCTTPERPQQPIMPGEIGKVKVSYNAAAVSAFQKSVFIKIAGITNPKTVDIKGEVMTAENYEAYLKTLPPPPPPPPIKKPSKKDLKKMKKAEESKTK